MLYLKILTPEKELFSGEVKGVRLPGTMGSFQILRNHAPIISSLSSGLVHVRQNGEVIKFSISGGFVECVNNKVNVLVEQGERCD